MENLDLLKKETEQIQLGGRIITIEEMMTSKAFKAIEKYQKAFDIIEKAKRKIKGSVIDKTKVMQRYQDAIVKVCLYIIRPPFSFKNFPLWTSNKTINKKWIYTHTTLKQLTRFINKVLEPIIPNEETKKKIEEVEKVIGL